MKYLNYYECSECGARWEDEWDCACNDKCPDCNAEIEPYKSEEIEDKIPVEIYIQGGVIADVVKPDNIKVIIKDYDTDGVDEEILKQDKNGDDYREFIFE